MRIRGFVEMSVWRGRGRRKDKGCCGRKALKKLPALFIIHPVSQDWIIPRKTTAEINNTAEGRSRSEDQGSHKPAMPFADYGRNTLKLHRYECTTSSFSLCISHPHTHTPPLPPHSGVGLWNIRRKHSLTTNNVKMYMYIMTASETPVVPFILFFIFLYFSKVISRWYGRYKRRLGRNWIFLFVFVEFFTLIKILNWWLQGKRVNFSLFSFQTSLFYD